MHSLKTFLTCVVLVPLPFLRSASAASSSASQGREGHNVSVSDSGALQRSRHVETSDKGPSLVRQEPRVRPTDTPELTEETSDLGTLKLVEVGEHSQNEVGQEEELELPLLPPDEWVRDGVPVPVPHQRQRQVPQDDLESQHADLDEGDLSELDDLQFDLMRNSLQKKGGSRRRVVTRRRQRRRYVAPCVWHGWSAWSACTKVCASGSHTRKRQYSGPCHGPSTQSAHCNTHACPIPCTFNSWGGWGGCSKTCNSGTKRRHRSKSGPYHGGRACPAHPTVNVLKCNTHFCPIDCVWKPWGGWGACSKSCGKREMTHLGIRESMGSYTRLRDSHGPFHGGRGCGGSKSHTTNCNIFECPVDCIWSQWEKWTECPVSCGGGANIRKRTQVPEVAYGGVACLGVSNMNAACSPVTCPINCVWAAWTEWGDCSSTCGNEGFMNAKRQFLIHPKHGGAVCEGNHTRATQCNVLDCPVDCLWSEWGNWSNCSNPCGGGMHQALRIRKSHARFGGQRCNGTDLKAESCNNHTCPSLEMKGGSDSMHQVPLLILMAVLLPLAVK